MYHKDIFFDFEKKSWPIVATTKD